MAETRRVVDWRIDRRVRQRHDDQRRGKWKIQDDRFGEHSFESWSMTVADRIPLLLLPGLLDTETLWRQQVENLCDIADMTIGDLTYQESIAEMAASVLAQAPERFALAGLSMGGYTGLEIMRQAPERVTRLALLDTTPYGDTPEPLTRRR